MSYHPLAPLDWPTVRPYVAEWMQAVATTPRRSRPLDQPTIDLIVEQVGQRLALEGVPVEDCEPDRGLLGCRFRFLCMDYAEVSFDTQVACGLIHKLPFEVRGSEARRMSVEGLPAPWPDVIDVEDIDWPYVVGMFDGD